jgi:hypothetical protein
MSPPYRSASGTSHHTLHNFAVGADWSGPHQDRLMGDTAEWTAVCLPDEQGNDPSWQRTLQASSLELSWRKLYLQQRPPKCGRMRSRVAGPALTALPLRLVVLQPVERRRDISARRYQCIVAITRPSTAGHNNCSFGADAETTGLDHARRPVAIAGATSRLRFQSTRNILGIIAPLETFATYENRGSPARVHENNFLHRDAAKYRTTPAPPRRGGTALRPAGRWTHLAVAGGR